MGALAVGDVVLIRFPFSNLSTSKLRPALVVAEADFHDVVVCQITSRPYSSARAIRLTDADFMNGGLSRESYARADKLFTASASIVTATLGALNAERLAQVRSTAADLFAPIVAA